MGNVASRWGDLPARTKYETIMTMVGFSGALLFSYVALDKVLKRLDPTAEEKKKAEERAKAIMKDMGIELEGNLNEYELCIASNLVDTSAIKVEWKDIGGLQHVIDEINEMVILPFTRPELFYTSSLLRPPKGVLLHGPPGCGKTMIAKATAKAAGARFINLQASVLFDKWYGESQKRAEAIFSLASRIAPTIIFIDEIDAFLRSRGGNDHESTALVKAQFMSLWDGLVTDHDSRVLIMGATNRPMDVDPAFRRRMPCMFKIEMPETASREEILRVLLHEEQIDNLEVLVKTVAENTAGFSGSDLKELCRHAAVFRIREYIESGDATGDQGASAFPILRPLKLADFIKGLSKIRNTSQEIRGVYDEMVD